MPEPYEESGKISKAEAVRRAVAVGILSPVEGAKWIKQEYCMEVPPVYFSVIKRRMGLKAPGNRAALRRGKAAVS